MSKITIFQIALFAFLAFVNIAYGINNTLNGETLLAEIDFLWVGILVILITLAVIQDQLNTISKKQVTKTTIYIGKNTEASVGVGDE